MNSIPPQAYTRDTLVKAIEWMQSQPLALRERANSADLLVSYYLQACRKAAAHMEAPVSQENFKADLRHLAQGLKQFDEPSAPPHSLPGRSPSYGNTHSHLKVEPLFSVDPPPGLEATPVAPPPSQTPPPQTAPPVPTAAPRARQAHNNDSQWAIDPKSLGIAREFQARLNLSSEAEAIRMLLTLGAERARQLFP